VIVLYALAEAGNGTGLGSLTTEAGPLHIVRCGTLDAVVADLPLAPARTVEAAQQHAEVVATITARLPAVPVRFGSWHADEGSLRAALGVHAEELRDRVRAVGDAVEFLVRPAGAAPPPVQPVPAPAPADHAPPGTPGRSYLEGRLAQAQAARAEEREAAARLLAATAPLEPLAREHRVVRGRAGIERCFLVARDDADRFAELVRELTAGTDLLAAGPWPPFTFAAAATGPDEVLAPRGVHHADDEQVRT
jgi:hypothetical protein